MKPAATKPRNRSFGLRSPLDRLPKAVAAEMWRRCLAGQIFREIQTWLKQKHGVKASLHSLSAWRRRKLEILGTASSSAHTFALRGPVEILVSAPVANQVRVEVRRAAKGHAS